MQSSFRIPIFLILFVLGSLPLTAQNTQTDNPGKSTSKQSPAVKPTPDEPASSKITFPDVDGWDRDEPYKYPTPDAGYSVNFNSRTNGRVTLYVYNGGHSKIPNELTGLVKEELEAAKAGIQAAVDAGIYGNLKESKMETVVLGGTKGKISALRSHFTLTREGEKLNSDIYLFPYKNNFIKLRVTRPASTDKTMDESFANLLYEIDSLFTK
ncbi:MAG: hypothetical protein H7070_07225 [Saprospiraceae bacterium]|nr:hypothetical protein [Pyrinomonadaceae bacterium]